MTMVTGMEMTKILEKRLKVAAPWVAQRGHDAGKPKGLI